MLGIDTVLQGRYRIVRSLGQGGMGAVYKAIDERLNKTVAIKEVLVELEASTAQGQRALLQKAFQREANSLVKAKHETVPDITDFFSEQESRFLVMEYVEGDDLGKMLEKRERPFSLEEVSPWIDQLLGALNYLHNLTPPILHRDIKPQNLKLNEWQKIKLLDFGIARSTDKSSTLSQHTFLAATLNYAPLEQVLRVIAPTFREFILLKHRGKAEKFLEQDTDARCDIFGVGATFYHLLTNQVPVDVTKRALEIWENGTDELTDPSEINPEISPNVSAWLLKAMAFEREDRFTSASEMKEAFRRTTAEDKHMSPMIGLAEAGQGGVVTGEQQLMQAKTERLIDPMRTEKENSSLYEHPSKPRSELNIGTTGDFTPAEFALTDFNTDFAVQPTSANLIDGSIIDEKTPVQPVEIETNKTARPVTKGSGTKTRKYVLASTIAGILVIGVITVGLYVVLFLLRPAPQEENSTAIENVNISQTPKATASSKEGTLITEGSGETNTEPSPVTVGKETQSEPPIVARPTPAPTSRIIVEKTPSPTPVTNPTVNKTPRPQNATHYVVCYVKFQDGTIKRIRKTSCNECPAKTACEVFY